MLIRYYKSKDGLSKIHLDQCMRRLVLSMDIKHKCVSDNNELPTSCIKK